MATLNRVTPFSYREAAAVRRGFTLVEILVVISIVGIIAGAVSLSVSGGPQRRAREEAESLRDCLQLAVDEAVFQNIEIGLQLGTKSYGFVRFDAQNNVWVPLTERAFRRQSFLESTRLSLVLEGRSVLLADNELKESPAVIMLASGEVTPFTLKLTSVADKTIFLVASDGVSSVRVTETAND